MKLAGNVTGNVNRSAGFAGNDLCEEYTGCIIGTVSRVINNHTDVSEAARKKILAVIDEYHFQPNTNAKLLKKMTATEVTIVVKGTNNYFLEALLEEVQKNLKENGGRCE